MQRQMNIVCFKWTRAKSGMQLPHVCDYTSRHVNALKRGITRNTTIPHRFTCITDDWRGLDSDIDVVTLWDKCKVLGGCYNRLYIFSEAMTDYVGERFLCIDLDSVVVGNIDGILSRQEAFVINRYRLNGKWDATHQYYNGGLFMMNAGCRARVWDTFDPVDSVKEIEKRKALRELCGSDQAWISYVLGGNEAVFTDDDGVLDYRLFEDKHQLPKDAKIVMFPGMRDPSLEYRHVHWIRQHWL
jgi:hypothetical protein